MKLTLHQQMMLVYQGYGLDDLVPEASDRIKDAWSIAKWLHCRQYRKGAHPQTGRRRPYTQHVLQVFLLVRAAGGSENEQIAALLHDSVEDAAISWPGITPSQVYKALYHQFGWEVAALVARLTNKPGFDGIGKSAWQTRQLVRFPHIRLVKAADKVANAFDTCVAPPQDWSAKQLAQSLALPQKVFTLYPALPASLQHFYQQHVKPAA